MALTWRGVPASLNMDTRLWGVPGRVHPSLHTLLLVCGTPCACGGGSRGTQPPAGVMPCTHPGFTTTMGVCACGGGGGGGGGACTGATHRARALAGGAAETRTRCVLRAAAATVAPAPWGRARLGGGAMGDAVGGRRRQRKKPSKATKKFRGKHLAGALKARRRRRQQPPRGSKQQRQQQSRGRVDAGGTGV